MAENQYQRPKDAFRFHFEGVQTRDTPDSLAPGKFAAAVNIRSTGNNSIRTRPGYVPLFTGGNNAITDIRGYASLSTDSLPRLLARDANGGVWLDNNNSVGNLAGNAGYGASMVTFRPAESPNSWMYIGAEGDYQKFSAPSNSNVVTQYKVGIAEPQAAVDACPITVQFTDFSSSAANWAVGGTASNHSDGMRSNDAITTSIQDPVYATRFSVGIANNASGPYGIGESVYCGVPAFSIVEDIIPPIPANISISSSYFSNNVCTIVTTQMSTGNSNSLSWLRRGALVSIGGNAYLVLGTVPGPGGNFAFEIASSGNVSGNVSGVNTIVLSTASVGSNLEGFYVGADIGAGANNAATGIGTLTQIFATNPFSIQFSTGGAYSGPNALPRTDDYIHISMSFSDPTQLVQMLILFNLDGGSNNNNFSGNALYYAIHPGDLVGITAGNTTQLSAMLQSAENLIIEQLPTSGNISAPSPSGNANNEYAEIRFPVSALNRLGADQTKSLQDCTAVQLQINVANNTSVRFGSLWVGGGGGPDTGNNGSPYTYQCVPLSSSTGVRGNPTPVMRYGVNPLRQNVVVKTSSLNSSYDSQVDTWEVYRYGGSVDSYRFIGTAPAGSDFLDQYFDDAATAGDPIPIDNTEPWPSIDVPYRANNNITAFGPFLTIAGNVSTAFPATISRWLPGTIFQIGGQEAFTLRSRPVSLGGNNGYQFEFEECIGSGNQSSVFVLEPNVARQTLPYLWGPNEQGYVFACGDPLRPGVVSWSKAFAPDAVPTAYNLELCPPSEPLLGGEVLAGVSLVASSLRWWALYFQAGGTPLYSQVEVSVGKRLAAPWGKCSDGAILYFWATDCIAATGAQGPAVSLTDTDIFNLFPHGGLSGRNVTRGTTTYYAPDYSRAATFRLSIREGILYALYQDSGGNYRMLIGERRSDGTFAWSQDAYPLSMSAVYSIEQPKGTLELAPALYPAVVMGSNNGQVVKLQDLTNDGNTSITPFVYTPEWDGGDLRAAEAWGDQYVDVLAIGNMTVTPVYLGNNVATPTAIAGNANRQFVPVSLAGGALVNFLGLQFSWTDNFSNNSNATHLYAWQPSFVQKPETITNRFGDWYDFGQASYVRGVIIHADTFGSNKNISIRNADNNALVTFSGVSGNGTINHNNEQEIAYYFPTPFVAHMVRDEPQDLVPWRKFGIEWIKDPWPELTNLASAWMNLGKDGAKFLRGAVLPVDTNGNNVSLTLISSDGGNVSLGPFNTTAAEKTAVAWPFATPLIGHDFQLVPSAPIRVWYDEIRWDSDLWPELIAEASPWISLGTPGAKYLRGAVIPIDTNGAAVSLTFLSSDGGSVTVGPFSTTAGEKTEAPWAFSIPLVGHQFQLIPTGAVRVWYEEIRWDFQPWPELISEATGWMPVLAGGGAAFLQGLVLPIETDGVGPALSILTDTGQTIALTATVTPPANVKTGVAYSLATPVICHQIQILPTAPCRVWLDEIQWIAEPTPEQASTWVTQWSGLGSTGFKSIPRIELSWSSTSDVSLHVESYDGASPIGLLLPNSSGDTHRKLFTLTLNKGTLYRFSATSANPFQIFLEDFSAYVSDWGRSEPSRIFRGVGGTFGDRARI